MTGTSRGASTPSGLGPRGDMAWSVLAGAAVAVGLAGARGAYGLLGMAALFVGIALLTLVSAWSVADELHLEQGPLLRTLPLTVGLGTVATAGWCDLAGAYGLLVVAMVALSSPAFGNLLRRRLPQLTRSAPPTGVRVDQAAVDRRFQGMVKGLDDDDPGGSISVD